MKKVNLGMNLYKIGLELLLQAICPQRLEMLMVACFAPLPLISPACAYNFPKHAETIAVGLLIGSASGVTTGGGGSRRATCPVTSKWTLPKIDADPRGFWDRKMWVPLTKRPKRVKRRRLEASLSK